MARSITEYQTPQTLKRTAKWVALILCSISAIACVKGTAPVDAYSGTVTKVHDGDSIHLTPPGKKRLVIRLAAIDAPEIDQLHGITSRDHLRKTLLNKQAVARCHKRDQYQRHVCRVFIENRDTNLLMLESGHAWYYERFKDEQSFTDQRAYKKASESAKKYRRGLWRNPAAIPPWAFRKQK